MGISVKEALMIGGLKKGEVVAGEKGLNRRVDYVDILEVPDMLGWLKEGELILTTGYVIKDNPELQEKLVLKLAEVNGAGIAIKVKRFLDKVPEIMIETANKVNIPIIQLPPEVPYVEITHPLLKEILLSQSEEKQENNLLKEILFGDFSDATLMKKKISSRIPQFNINGPFIIMVFSDNNGFNLQKILEYYNLQQEKSVLTGKINGFFTVVYSGTIAKDSDWKKKLEKVLICNFLEFSKNTVCIIDKVRDFESIGREYNKLKNALDIIRVIRDRKVFPIKDRLWYFYDEISYYILLYHVAKIPEGEEFVNSLLKPFASLPRKEQEDLLWTLYQYVKNGGNLARTSRDCFLHRNTVIYRVNKLKNLGIFPNSHEEMFKYYLGLLIYYIQRND